MPKQHHRHTNSAIKELERRPLRRLPRVDWRTCFYRDAIFLCWRVTILLLKQQESSWGYGRVSWMRGGGEVLRFRFGRQRRFATRNAILRWSVTDRRARSNAAPADAPVAMAFRNPVAGWRNRATLWFVIVVSSSSVVEFNARQPRQSTFTRRMSLTVQCHFGDPLIFRRSLIPGSPPWACLSSRQLYHKSCGSKCDRNQRWKKSRLDTPCWLSCYTID